MSGRGAGRNSLNAFDHGFHGLDLLQRIVLRGAIEYLRVFSPSIWSR